MIRVFLPGEPRIYHNYAAALEGCGGSVVFGTEAGEFSVADACDALLLPGGADVDPIRYGEENTASVGIDASRDAWEIALIERFFAAGKPILGVCRGHQVINVAFGGSLIQHLDGAARHARGEHPTDRAHRVRLTENGFLYALYGEQCDSDGMIAVNSSHHQAVRRLADGFETLAVSDDGVVEAIAHGSAPVYGVQFHPERMCFANRRSDTVDGRAIFDWFVRLCEAASIRKE
ncbi:MAG: gamma-glutamyl-gamma-aminobutyrate hydrolase family protein [Clostridia bacterium]|nr:gamma-glutamyl-gamma-aminobutyrate hydrolase family protein [Clostridia bacterium]